MKIVWVVIVKLFWFIVGIFTKPNKDEKIKRDGQLAENIRDGNGREIAEDFKKRKQYEKL